MVNKSFAIATLLLLLQKLVKVFCFWNYFKNVVLFNVSVFTNFTMYVFMYVYGCKCMPNAICSVVRIFSWNGI